MKDSEQHPVKPDSSPTAKETAFMEQAIALASENVRSGNGGPFGAVIVCNGEVAGRGVNLVTANNDPSAHAEVTAIRDACRALARYDLRGCTIYTSCEPCPMCLSAIYWAHLDAIVYGNSVEDAARAGFDDEHIFGELKRSREARRIPSRSLLRDEAQSSFALWEQSPNRIDY